MNNGKTKTSSSPAQQELEKAKDQFDAFDQSVKDMTMDRMNMAPKELIEPQTKLSQKEIEKSKDIYLKPSRTIMSKEKFNEKYREDYNFAKEYVHFIAEHNEIKGETIDLWTKPFPGCPAEYWNVPSNKPVWGPRFLAERLKGCQYHRLTMLQNQTTGSDGMGQYYGAMAVDTTVQRLDAHPVSQKKSVFMGESAFKAA